MAIEKMEYLADAAVNVRENAEIITLLSTCFVGPGNEMFLTRRYFREPPAHRMVFRDDSGVIRGQVAGHEKVLGSGLGPILVLGISEVAVHPDWRGRGLSRRLLSEFEAWASLRGFLFSVLFGAPSLYGPQGYSLAGNAISYTDAASGRTLRSKVANMQYKALKGGDWPEGLLSLGGPVW